MTVPIAVSLERDQFSPQLTLRGDSRNGNGPFGVGWSLSFPQISRQTDKGVPRHLAAQESDVLLLYGADDLVPADARNDTRALEGLAYQVCPYRPRIEGLFVRIERFSRSDGVFEVFWRSIEKNNTTTCYGRSAQSRTTDTKDSIRAFSLLVCESTDDKGQTIVYDHVGEDNAVVYRADTAESRTHATGIGEAVAKVATTALETSIAESVLASKAANTTGAGKSAAKALLKSLAEREAPTSFAELMAHKENRRLHDDLGLRPIEAKRIAKEFQAGLDAMAEVTLVSVILPKVDARRSRPRPK